MDLLRAILLFWLSNESFVLLPRTECGLVGRSDLSDDLEPKDDREPVRLGAVLGFCSTFCSVNPLFILATVARTLLRGLESMLSLSSE